MFKDILKLNNKLFVFISILLINFPKFNIISIGGFSQGIRLDDLLFFLLIFYYGKNILISKQTRIISTIFLISLFVGLINHPFNGILKIFYLIRFLQYIIFFELSRKILQKNELFFVLKFTFYFQFIYSLAQYILNSFQFRVTGTTAGPWEVSIIMLLTCIFLFNQANNKKTKFLLIFMIFSFLIMSAARAQFVAFLIIIGFLLPFSNRKKIIVGIIMITLGILFKNLFLNGFGYLEFGKLSTTLEQLSDYFISEIKSKTLDFGEGGSYFGDCETLDCSFISRIQQWAFYIKSGIQSTNSTLFILFGAGPGSGGTILDGWYIKLFVDFGLLGTLYYIYFLYKNYTTELNKIIIIILSISCLTLDVYWASKIGYCLCIILPLAIILNKNEKLLNTTT